jgi:hypothetical protein
MMVVQEIMFVWYVEIQFLMMIKGLATKEICHYRYIYRLLHIIRILSNESNYFANLAFCVR